MTFNECVSLSQAVRANFAFTDPSLTSGCKTVPLPWSNKNREPMASAQKTFRVSLIINEVPQIHDPKQTVGNSHFLFRHIAALWFCLCLDGLGIEAVFAPMQYSVLGCA